MSPDDFITTPEFEPEIKEEPEDVSEDEVAAIEEEEPTEEELEAEPVLEAEEQEVGDDPVRLYLHEIGRVHLLTADNEKTIARKIELGKRISEVRRELEKQGKHPSATEIYLYIINDIGRSIDLIRALQEYLKIPSGARLREIVTSDKFHRAIDGVLDQQMSLDISGKWESLSATRSNAHCTFGKRHAV
jgi:RNA polymerase primary sigma factor